MALQGTLETFALPDVLRLLASTKKSGVLRVENDRGHGELVVVDGALSGGSASSAPRAEKPSDVLFELLRSTDGSFVFDADATVESDSPGDEVESTLAQAEAQLVEWREIEAVVPSPFRNVTIRADRGDDDITLTGPQWRAIAAIGSGCTVDELGDRLGLPELPAARAVRDLVQLDAVELSPADVDRASDLPVDPPAPVSTVEPDPEPEQVWQPDTSASGEVVDQTPPPPSFEAPTPTFEPPTFEPPVPAPPTFASESLGPSEPSARAADGTPVAPLFGAPSEPPAPPAVDLSDPAPPPPPAPPTWEQPASFAPSGSSSFFDDDEDDEDPLADDPFGPDPFRIPRLPSTGLNEADDSEAAEMARQLANLSPKAAQAVAAAAAATSDEEREQALAQVSEETDEPINRGLLLKFLSSVDE